jgi:hypothetical protein
MEVNAMIDEATGGSFSSKIIAALSFQILPDDRRNVSITSNIGGYVRWLSTSNDVSIVDNFPYERRVCLLYFFVCWIQS